MAKIDLTATLAGLGVELREFAYLIEEDEAKVLRWAEGRETAPGWLELFVRTWRDHPALLALARETAAARLDGFAPIENDLVFQDSA